MFFASDNPIALLLALIITLVILKVILSKHKWFSGKNSGLLAPVLVIAAILMIGYRGILHVISFSIPLIALVFAFLFFLGVLYFGLGIPINKIGPTIGGNGAIRIGVIIAVFCILALAGSRLMGQSLLEDKSVSLGDVMMTKEEPVEIDFSGLFTSGALGLIIIFLVIGIVFVWVNIA